MAGYLKFLYYFISGFILSGLCSFVIADEVIAELSISERNGITRQLEYVEFEIQLPMSDSLDMSLNFIAERQINNQEIPCQVVRQKFFKTQRILQLRLIFPVSLEAYHTETYLIKAVKENNYNQNDLSYSGEGLELVIENKYFRADLTRSNQSEGKNHESGQLRELLVKNGFDVLLLRNSNRMHWGPNFQNQQVEYYKTIAGWERPENYHFIDGPYLIRTMRSDRAPEHPEILLTANYSFYADLPYFKFYSSMVFDQDLTLLLLRNDEMTMDSLFTHVAFRQKSGKIVDLPFSERYKVLDSEPIENDAPWLCFYNANKGYAFGSIRIRYDIINNHGESSPTYLPYTKISDGEGGGKYWNRLLIHDHPVIVPAGSRYIEENAYIVFEIYNNDKFSEIEKWADIILHPLELNITNKN